MAEALAAVGVVASIIQLVDFGTKVLRRLNEFHSSLEKVPKSLRNITVELPLLLDTLDQTKRAIESGSIEDKTQKALQPAIDGCRDQIGLLQTILTKLLPTSSDSWNKRHKKAVLSLIQEAKVDEITTTLRNYIQILTYYHAAASSRLEPLKGTDALQPTRGTEQGEHYLGVSPLVKQLFSWK